MQPWEPGLVLAFRVVGLAMAAASMVLVTLQVARIDLTVVLLSVGLFTLAVASIIESARRRETAPMRGPRPQRRRKKRR